MKTMTATQLRREIFSVLDEALMGRDTLVSTRRGQVIVRKADRAAWRREAGQPKIAGRIEGDLAEADVVLRRYIQWPHA